MLKRLNMAGAGILALALMACSQGDSDDENREQSRLADARDQDVPANSAGADRGPEGGLIIEEMPDACTLLDSEMAGGLLGSQARREVTGGGDPFRSGCRYEIASQEADRSIAVMVSSLRRDMFDYRSLDENQYITRVSGMIAPDYKESHLVRTVDDIGAGAYLFDVEGDISVWTNTAIGQPVAFQDENNEYFIAVHVAGFGDITHMQSMAEDLARHIQDGLEHRAGG